TERDDILAVGALLGERPTVALALDRPDQALAYMEAHDATLEPGFGEHRVVSLLNHALYALYTNAEPEELLRRARRFAPFSRSMLSRGQFIGAEVRFQVAQLFVTV